MPGADLPAIISLIISLTRNLLDFRHETQKMIISCRAGAAAPHMGLFRHNRCDPLLPGANRRHQPAIPPPTIRISVSKILCTFSMAYLLPGSSSEGVHMKAS